MRGRRRDRVGTAAVEETLLMVISPAGARITWQILLKPSLYSLTGTLGCRRTWSGVMRSARRVGCTLMVSWAWAAGIHTRSRNLPEFSSSPSRRGHSLGSAKPGVRYARRIRNL